jgi:DNA invertase Pin-like site-specific DNA recombinase
MGREIKHSQVIGYLRTSTNYQNPASQRHVINDFCQRRKMFVDEFIQVGGIGGTKGAKERRIYELLERVRTGDTIVVSELSRLGRSTIEILALIKELAERKVRLIAVKQGLDITGSDMMSQAMLTLFSLFAEMERDLLSERTKAGLARIQAEGKRIGRPPGPGKSKLDVHKEEIARLYAERRLGPTALGKIFDCSAGTMQTFILKKNSPSLSPRLMDNSFANPQ